MEERVYIKVISEYDGKAFKEAAANLDTLETIAGKFNLPFDQMSKKMNILGTSSLKSLDLFSASMKKGIDPIWQSVGDMGMSQMKGLERQINRLGFSYRDVADGSSQLVNMTTGMKAKLSDVFSSAERKASIFDMRLLSIMFFGMQLQRTFGGFLTTAIQGYKKLTDAQTPTGKALLRMEASWEFLKFAVIDALEPMIMFFTDFLTKVFDFIGAHPQLAAAVGVITGLLAAAGTFMFIGGQLQLFLGAIGGATISSELVAALGAGGWLVGLGAAGIAIAVGVRWAYDNNLFGIKDALDEFAKVVKPISESIVGFMDDIRNKLIELGQTFLDKFKNMIPSILTYSWNVINPIFEGIKGAIQSILNLIDAFKLAISSLPSINLPTLNLPTIPSILNPIATQTNTPANMKSMGDFIWRAGQAPISISPKDNIVGTKSGTGVGITIANTYNISGIGDQNSLKRMLEEHDRQIYAEILRQKIPGI
jgi:hypothetical protein